MRSQPSRSGTIELPVGELGSYLPSQWYPVCSIDRAPGDDDKVEPRTVRVRVSKASHTNQLWSASLTAGVWWAPDDTFNPWAGELYHGAIRFSYGYKGMLRHLYCDLRSGEYQIPPCEYLRVSATRYTPAVDVSGEFPFTVDRTPMQIEGEISDGVAADFTPMVFTASSQWIASEGDDSFSKVACPPGAYAFEVYPVAPGDSVGNRFETYSPASVRDFVSGVWIPPSSPLPLIEDHVTIASIGSVARDCQIVFFVR